MNVTQLLILPHVQSLLLTILQTQRQQSEGFVLSKKQDGSASQVHHRLTRMWARKKNNEYLTKCNLEQYYFRLEIHSVS